MEYCSDHFHVPEQYSMLKNSSRLGRKYPEKQIFLPWWEAKILYMNYSLYNLLFLLNSKWNMRF